MGKGQSGCERTALELPEGVKPKKVTFQRLNQLKKSTDKKLQTPEAREFLEALEAINFKELDPLTPWIAKQFKEENMKVDEDGIIRFKHRRHWRRLPIRSYAEWYSSNHKTRKGFQVMDADLGEVWKRISEYKAEMKARERQKKIAEKLKKNTVYKFEDGWRIVRLVTGEDLENESEMTGHCVGEGLYHQACEDESTFFFSLRDKDNKAHVTFDITPGALRKGDEVVPKSKKVESFNSWEVDFHYGTVNSIYGHKDSVPKDPYKARIKEFFTSIPESMRPARINYHTRVEAPAQLYNLVKQKQFGEGVDEYGLKAHAVRIHYPRLLTNIAKQKSGEQEKSLKALRKWVAVRGEERHLRNAVRKLQVETRYKLGPQASWDHSRRAAWVEGVAMYFNLSLPDNHKIEARIIAQAYQKPGKSDTNKAWQDKARQVLCSCS